MVRRPVRFRIEPHGERLGEIFVRMALRVPVIEVLDEALAVRLRRVVLRIGDRRITEDAPARRPASQRVRVVDCMADFVTQDLQAREFVAALHLKHLRKLQLLEARIREIKRNRDARHPVGCEPFVGQPVAGAKRHAARVQVGGDLTDADFEICALDRQPEIAHAQLEQLLVRQRGPVGRLQRLATWGCCFHHSVSRS